MALSDFTKHADLLADQRKSYLQGHPHTDPHMLVDQIDYRVYPIAFDVVIADSDKWRSLTVRGRPSAFILGVFPFRDSEQPVSIGIPKVELKRRVSLHLAIAGLYSGCFLPTVRSCDERCRTPTCSTFILSIYHMHFMPVCTTHAHYISCIYVRLACASHAPGLTVSPFQKRLS